MSEYGSYYATVISEKQSRLRDYKAGVDKRIAEINSLLATISRSVHNHASYDTIESRLDRVNQLIREITYNIDYTYNNTNGSLHWFNTALPIVISTNNN